MKISDIETKLKSYGFVQSLYDVNRFELIDGEYSLRFSSGDDCCVLTLYHNRTEENYGNEVKAYIASILNDKLSASQILFDNDNLLDLPIRLQEIYDEVAKDMATLELDYITTAILAY
jgi:hypothetical protein